MYDYRRDDLAVNRFYTSNAIWRAMAQMEEFDSSLRNAVDAGGDDAIQFIRQAGDGTIVPCSPNKILIATTQTLRPNKRLLPIGFRSGHRTGRNGIKTTIAEIDQEIQSLFGEEMAKPSDAPKLISWKQALALLSKIETTLAFPDEDAPLFDWDSTKAVLTKLSQQSKLASNRGKVLLWAAKNRNSARYASARSHARYIETPHSMKTEGKIAKSHAIDHPILFLLRQTAWRKKVGVRRLSIGR